MPVTMEQLMDLGSRAAPTAAIALPGRPALDPSIPRSLLDEQRSFAAVLARGQSANTMMPQAKAREAAMQLVAVALVQPILKELRDTNSAAPPFAPTQGEQQFRALMDAELAQRVVQAARFPLVDRLAQELLDRAERANPTTPEPGAMSGAETGT